VKYFEFISKSNIMLEDETMQKSKRLLCTRDFI